MPKDSAVVTSSVKLKEFAAFETARTIREVVDCFTVVGLVHVHYILLKDVYSGRES